MLIESSPSAEGLSTRSIPEELEDDPVGNEAFPSFFKTNGDRGDFGLEVSTGIIALGPEDGEGCGDGGVAAIATKIKKITNVVFLGFEVPNSTSADNQYFWSMKNIGIFAYAVQ